MSKVIFKYKNGMSLEEKMEMSEILRDFDKDGFLVLDERITVIVITDDGVEVIE